ncbi:MAG: hypothetical protein WDO19_25330 [Bacteroidota bacterium]
MAVTLLTGLWINDELSFDNTTMNAERIYHGGFLQQRGLVHYW